MNNKEQPRKLHLVPDDNRKPGIEAYLEGIEKRIGGEAEEIIFDENLEREETDGKEEERRARLLDQKRKSEMAEAELKKTQKAIEEKLNSKEAQG
ncbi:MAG: hypothetical protein WC609_02260 [Candidatus Paceibacterota bacterium]|jgi:hypothetical protein